MDKRRPRVLILGTDPDTLITLQHALEEAEVDTTITWDEAEAFQLVETAPFFNLILVADHPPQLNAAAIIDDLSFRGTCPPVLILTGVVGEKGAEHFCRLGASGVVRKRDPIAVLGEVTKTLAPMQFRTKSAKAGSAEGCSWRAAS